MKTLSVILIVATLALTACAQELRQLPDMTKSALPSAKDAEDALVGHIMRNHEGLSATAAPSTKAAFVLGHDLADFGKRGDRVWQVHLIEFGETKQIAWVNAESKAVRCIYPENDKKVEQSAAPLPRAPASHSEGAR